MSSRLIKLIHFGIEFFLIFGEVDDFIIVVKSILVKFIYSMCFFHKTMGPVAIFNLRELALKRCAISGVEKTHTEFERCETR